MKTIKKCRAFILENKLFSLFFAGMAVYYAWRMFAIKPWYDELYTYYSFIAKGPIYAAIHWPVPNNHVLYSVLSAFWDYLGNPYLGLRACSYIAACANLILLYRLAGHFMDSYLAAGSVFLYAAAWQVNNLAVQGRGYTISITFYLIALLCLEKICSEKASFWSYAIYACSLTLGLYALISSTFWVIPVCFAGGVALLFTKRYKTMWKLIAASFAAAFMTFVLYAVIWLAIGSNLMSKAASNLYYGVYQVTIILKAPLEALKTGMEYMLATPYIQGDARSYIIAELFSYLTTLFHLFYSSAGEVLTVLCVCLGVLAAVFAVKLRKTDEKQWFFLVYLAVTVILLPIMLIVQSVQPYYRVFTFWAVPLSLLLVWGCQCLFTHLKWKKWNASPYVCGLLAVFGVFMLTSESYNSQFAQRETEIADILKEDIENIDAMFLADDYQKYVIKFYYDVYVEEVPLEESGYVLLPKEILNEDYEIPVWPTMYNHDALDLTYLEDNFIVTKESENYKLYKKR